MLALALLLAVTPVQDTLRYELKTSQSQEIDLSAAGQGSMTVDMALTARARLIVRDTTDGRVVEIVIDSSDFTSSNPMAASMGFKIDSGTVLRMMVREGQATPLDMPMTAALGTAMLAGLVGQLFPELPAQLDIGRAWSDTVVIDSMVQAGRMTGTTVLDWRVTGSEAGVLDLRADEVSNISMEMDGVSLGGATLGTRSAKVRGGTPLVEVQQESEGDMQMLMGNMAATVKQKQQNSARRIP